MQDLRFCELLCLFFFQVYDWKKSVNIQTPWRTINAKETMCNMKRSLELSCMGGMHLACDFWAFLNTCYMYFNYLLWIVLSQVSTLFLFSNTKLLFEGFRTLRVSFLGTSFHVPLGCLSWEKAPQLAFNCDTIPLPYIWEVICFAAYGQSILFYENIHNQIFREYEWNA